MSQATPASPLLSRATAPAPGRLTVMAFIGLAAGAVPLPFVPGAALRRIRGAVAHDVATRYGLSLTEDARKDLAEPSRTSRNGAFLATIAFVAKRTFRRFGALGLVPPVTAWLEVYALGFLFDRYLERVRSSQTVRIHGGEAKLVRKAIDSAMSRALSPSLELKARHPESEPAEKLRNFSTRLLYGMLLAVAAVPDHLRRRLETAFDAVLAEEPLHTP